MKLFWTLFHWLSFGRALARGPRSFARYEARRQVRRLSYGRKPKL